MLPFLKYSHLETSTVLSRAVSALAVRQKYQFCNAYTRVINPCVGQISMLTFWRRNYFCFNFSTPCISNVNNTETKYGRIMKQTAF